LICASGGPRKQTNEPLSSRSQRVVREIYVGVAAEDDDLVLGQRVAIGEQLRTLGQYFPILLASRGFLGAIVRFSGLCVRRDLRENVFFS
jgi:hypothetical protein